MGRNEIIALVVGVVVVGGLGFAVYQKRKSGFPPPPYVSAGPSPSNPGGPPLPGKFGVVAQDIGNTAQGGLRTANDIIGFIEDGQKTWNDAKELFS